MGQKHNILPTNACTLISGTDVLQAAEEHISVGHALHVGSQWQPCQTAQTHKSSVSQNKEKKCLFYVNGSQMLLADFRGKKNQKVSNFQELVMKRMRNFEMLHFLTGELWCHVSTLMCN